jgi:hypothetical protein
MTAAPLLLPIGHVTGLGRAAPCPCCHRDLVVFPGPAPAAFEYAPDLVFGEDGGDLGWDHTGRPDGWIPLRAHDCLSRTHQEALP